MLAGRQVLTGEHRNIAIAKAFRASLHRVHARATAAGVYPAYLRFSDRSEFAWTT